MRSTKIVLHKHLVILRSAFQTFFTALATHTFKIFRGVTTDSTLKTFKLNTLINAFCVALLCATMHAAEWELALSTVRNSKSVLGSIRALFSALYFLSLCLRLYLEILGWGCLGAVLCRRSRDHCNFSWRMCWTCQGVEGGTGIQGSSCKHD